MRILYAKGCSFAKDTPYQLLHVYPGRRDVLSQAESQLQLWRILIGTRRGTSVPRRDIPPAAAPASSVFVAPCTNANELT